MTSENTLRPGSSLPRIADQGSVRARVARRTPGSVQGTTKPGREFPSEIGVPLASQEAASRARLDRSRGQVHDDSNCNSRSPPARSLDPPCQQSQPSRAASTRPRRSRSGVGWGWVAGSIARGSSARQRPVARLLLRLASQGSCCGLQPPEATTPRPP